MHLLTDQQEWDPFPPIGEAQAAADLADRRAGRRALAVSAAGLAATGAIELVIAVVSGSVGLLGDAIHNLSDVSTSLVLVAGFRLSARPATPRFPYGYERAEDLGGLGVALVVWLSAAFAGVASVHKLTEHGHTSDVGLGIAATVVGIAGNQLVARYKGRVGHRIHSAALVADAHHSWLDSLASGGALVGLAGVALGVPWADGVAGLIVTGFIVHVGWKVTSELLVHLMDGVEPAVLERAEHAALSVPGVGHVHVRARWLGRSLLIELDGFIAGSNALDAAEARGRAVREAVMAAVPESRAVLWTPHSLPLADARRATNGKE
ncbi:MAG: cation diffusion facilitator family transporter [Acidimicrobiales bacterium]